MTELIPADDQDQEEPAAAGSSLPVASPSGVPEEVIGEILDFPEVRDNPQLSAKIKTILQVRSYEAPASFPLNALPHPDFLKGYEQIMPGVSERILQSLLNREEMLHAQVEHRQAIEGREQDRLDRAQTVNERAQTLDETESKGRLDITRRGQNFGLGITLLVIAVGAWLAYIGQPIAAAALFASSFAAIFVTGQHVTLKEAVKSRLAGKSKSADLPKGSKSQEADKPKPADPPVSA